MSTVAEPNFAPQKGNRSECYPLYGIVPIVNTPFDERLNIDVPSLERMLEQNITDGISGCIVPAVGASGASMVLAGFCKHESLPLSPDLIQSSNIRVTGRREQ